MEGQKCLVTFFQDFFGIAIKNTALPCRVDILCRADQQLYVKLTLQRGNLRADRRLRQKKLLGRF